ncbi:hypothetical protein [Carnobacterium sp.]|uniref:hypothetical protein n=1 Tax=Carnobacterium sp. TaxID=48221 RepID=UPI00388D7938
MKTELTQEITLEFCNYLKNSKVYIGTYKEIEKYINKDCEYTLYNFTREKEPAPKICKNIEKESYNIYIHNSQNIWNKNQKKRRTDIFLEIPNFCKCNFEIKITKSDLINSKYGKNLNNQFNFIICTPDIYYYVNQLLTTDKYKDVGIIVRESKNKFKILSFPLERSYDEHFNNYKIKDNYLWFES